MMKVCVEDVKITAIVIRGGCFINLSMRHLPELFIINSKGTRGGLHIRLKSVIFVVRRQSFMPALIQNQ